MKEKVKIMVNKEMENIIRDLSTSIRKEIEEMLSGKVILSVDNSESTNEYIDITANLKNILNVELGHKVDNLAKELASIKHSIVEIEKLLSELKKHSVTDSLSDKSSFKDSEYEDSNKTKKTRNKTSIKKVASHKFRKTTGKGVNS